MNRVYLPLLPLPVLAVIVAVSACSKAHVEETPHVIPPTAALEAPPAEAKPPSLEHAVAVKGGDDAPTPQDVKEFSRPVMK